MKEFVGHEDGQRSRPAQPVSVGIVPEMPVEARDRGHVESNAGRPRHVVGEDGDRTVAALARHALDRDAQSIGEAQRIRASGPRPQVDGGLGAGIERDPDQSPAVRRGDATKLPIPFKFEQAERHRCRSREAAGQHGRQRPGHVQRRAPTTAMKTRATSGASPSNSLRATASAWSSATMPDRSTTWPPTIRNMSGTMTLSPL